VKEARGNLKQTSSSYPRLFKESESFPPTPQRMADVTASYKKQDGSVSVSADGKTVSWKPASGAGPPVSIAIANIGSMSCIPEVAEKGADD
jgi:hypothetical protein